TIDNSDLNSGTLNSKTEILTAKTLHEGKKLFEISRNPSLKKIAVIGGGYIGVEAACAFREARDDIKIDLYQRSDSILNTYFDKEFSALGQEELEKHNINVILNSTLDSSSKNPKESNTVFDYDLVVEAVGFRPNSSLANVERIERSNAYKVNPYGQTSDSDIYAIGDCASVYNNVLEKDVNMPLGSYATHSAIIAAHHIGDTLLGSQPKHKHNGSQGASSVKVFDTILSSVGMTYSIAKEKAKEKSGAKDKFDKNVQFVDFSNVIKPKYLTAEQGNAPITVRCVFEKSTLKLLGFQIACSQDITPIIHLLSLALQNKMTAYDLRYLDMFFLPQLNQVYNFLQRTLSLVIKNNEA
ncbi:MAG: FAD-dependent oxidoreductase, partial [Bifidobacteriaceae bacterium]|nr:FAD-dependent oxidoreductase [Bifidobacteriaceae bacterium]